VDSEILNRHKFDPNLVDLSGPQLAFRQAKERNRVLSGANGSGKTFVGMIEARSFAEGTHPFRDDIAVPNMGWISSLTFPVSVEIIEPYLGLRSDPGIHPVFPPGYGIWKALDRQFHLPNGSVIGLKSADQGVLKYQGPKKTWVMFDEEPPEGVWQECGARIIGGRPLDRWITMTPTQGLTWVYDEFVMDPTSEHWIGFMVLKDNPVITASQIAKAEETYKRDPLKAARLLGEFCQVGARPVFDYETLAHWLNFAHLYPPLFCDFDPDGDLHEQEGGRLKVWDHPEPGFSYVVGADVAEGYQDGAWSVASVFRLPDLIQVAEFRERIAPMPFGRYLARIGRHYNDAFIVPEANNHGHATIGILIEHENYTHVYQRMAPDKHSMPSRTANWGFLTNASTKFLLESALQDAVVRGGFQPRSDILIKEMIAATYDELGRLTPGRGLWLDTVIAAGLALIGAADRRAIGWPHTMPPADTIDWFRWMAEQQRVSAYDKEDQLAWEMF